MFTQYFDLPPTSKQRHKLQKAKSGAILGFDCNFWDSHGGISRVCCVPDCRPHTLQVFDSTWFNSLQNH